MPSYNPQKPLRTALIGLSASATTAWASTAHLPNFLTSTGKSKFSIVALLNSSEKSARAAIQTYSLPVGTKAYGDPETLANDPNVDFVVCNTRVDKHFETTIKCISNGKHAYIEWPIASTLGDIQKLADAAKQSGAKVAIGLQGRWAPPVLKLKQIVEGKKLGRILSVEVRAYGGTRDREVLPEGLRYFAQRSVGGNPITIGFAHVVDFVLSVVGELVPNTVHTRFELHRPRVRVKSAKARSIAEIVQSDVPDFLALDGRLTSENASENAVLIFHFRRGQPFPGTPAFDWRINFEQGEVRLVSFSGISLQAAAYDEPVTIQLHRFGTDTIENVPWDWSDAQKEVPIRARGVMTCLYAFADGIREGEGWVGIEDAAARAQQIETWLGDGGW